MFRVEDNGDFDVAGGAGSSGVTITSSGQLTADGMIKTTGIGSFGKVETNNINCLGVGTFSEVFIGGTAINSSEFAVIDGAPTDGVTIGAKALVADANRDVSNIRNLGVTNDLTVSNDITVSNDLTVSNNLILSGDSKKITIGAGEDLTLTHDGSSTGTLSSISSLSITTPDNNTLTLKGDHQSSTAIHLDANATANSVLDIDAGILDIDTSGATNDSGAGISLDAAGTSNFSTGSEYNC